MKSKLRVVFGIGVFAGLAGGFVVSKKMHLKIDGKISSV